MNHMFSRVLSKGMGDWLFLSPGASWDSRMKREQMLGSNAHSNIPQTIAMTRSNLLLLGT